MNCTARHLLALVATAALLPGQDQSKLNGLVTNARESEEAGDLHGAIRFLRSALDLAPTRSDIRDVLSALHTRVGQSEYKARRYDSALLQFGAADRLTPNDERIVQSLGVIYHAKGRRFEAERYMKRVLRLNPDNLPALQVLATLAADRDDVQAASKYLARAAKVDPNSKELQNLASKFGREAKVEKTFVTRTQGGFRVQYESGKDAGVERNINVVFGLLKQAHRELEKELHGAPTGMVTVVVYTGEQFRKVRSTHAWAAAYYDGKIRLTVKPGTSLQESLRSHLRHELTHAFLFALHPKAPLWVHEGYAQYIEGGSVAAATGKFRSHGQQLLPKPVFLEKFASSKHMAIVERGYAQSLMAVGYLQRSGSSRQFRDFLALVGRGVGSDEALQQVYRFDVDTMLRLASGGR